MEFSKPYCSHPSLFINKSAVALLQHGATLYIDDKRYSLPNFRFSTIYKLIKNSSGFIPDIDYSKYVVNLNGYKQFLYTFVPCRKCFLCRERRKSDLVNMCNLEDSSRPFPALYFTLTYKPSCLPSDGLNYPDIQDFFRKLRYQLSSHGLDSNFKYLVAGEYGSKCSRRPHYHIVLYHNICDQYSPLVPFLFNLIFDTWGKCIKKSFNISFVRGFATSYVTKYIGKTYCPNGKNPTFIKHSHKLGFSSVPFSYLNSNVVNSFDYTHSRSAQVKTSNLGTYLSHKFYPSPSDQCNKQYTYSFNTLVFYCQKLVDARVISEHFANHLLDNYSLFCHSYNITSPVTPFCLLKQKYTKAIYFPLLSDTIYYLSWCATGDPSSAVPTYIRYRDLLHYDDKKITTAEIRLKQQNAVRNNLTKL